MPCQTQCQLIFSLFFIVSVSAYALEGQWTLRTSEITQLSLAPVPIVFTFQKTISNSGAIINTLTVKACSILHYQYSIDNDQIFLRFQASEEGSRPCLRGQIQFLRGKLDTIFYFYILKTALLMLPPNGQLPVKLDRLIDSTKPAINGIWSITQGLFFGPSENSQVWINGSQIDFCKGKSILSYKIADSENIHLTKSKEQYCDGLLLDTINGVSLFRISTFGSTPVLKMYDQDVNMVLELSYLSPYPIYQKIDYNPLVSNTSQTKSTNLATSSSKPQIPPKLIPPNETVSKTLTVPVQQNVVVSKQNITQNQQSANSSIPPPIKSLTTLNSTQQLKKNSTQSPIAPNNSITNNKQNNSNNSSNQTTASSISKNNIINNNLQADRQSGGKYQLVTSVTSLIGKWYPYMTNNIPALSSYGINAFISYQIIINQARITISGDCNTALSTYQFSQGIFLKTKPIATTKSCPNNKDSVIADIFFNENLFYISSSPNPIVQIKSSKGLLLLQLTQQPPSK